MPPLKNRFGDAVHPDGTIVGAEPCPVEGCRTPTPRYRMPDGLLKCGQNHRVPR